MISGLLLLMAAASAPGAGAPPEPAAVPASWHLIEGIASDGTRVWVSSVVDRTILQIGGDGVEQALPLPEQVGAPFGIAWDTGRNLLWIAAMCPSEPAVEHCGHSGLFAIDAEGTLRRSLLVEDTFNPGDVSVDGATGQVFASDSMNGAIYRCAGDCTELEAVIRPVERASAQGSVLSADGSRLIVADYSRGIMRIDMATGAQEMVKTADGKRLRGMDGLVRIGGSFVGIQNAGNPAQIVLFEIGEGSVLENVRAAVTAQPIAEATQLALAGDRLLVVGDAQWRHYAGPEAKGAEAQSPTPIIAIPLSELVD